jgi:hypothetical protein
MFGVEVGWWGNELSATHIAGEAVATTSKSSMSLQSKDVRLVNYCYQIIGVCADFSHLHYR